VITAQDEVADLAAQIQAAIVNAQNEAEAAGLDRDEAAAIIENSVYNLIIASGASPMVAAQALASARSTLTASGQLSRAASNAVSSVQAAVNASMPAIVPGAGGGAGGAPGVGGSGSAGGGGGGGGGSDYRPGT
jgi:uncharacterized membrane protein YgcG